MAPSGARIVPGLSRRIALAMGVGARADAGAKRLYPAEGGGVGLDGVVWAAFATTFPRGNRRVGKAELALIEGGGSVVEKKEAGGLPKGDAEKKPRTPFRLLLSRAPTWACVFANFVNNWGYFILLAWMPLYFKQVLGLDLARSSYFSALP